MRRKGRFSFFLLGMATRKTKNEVVFRFSYWGWQQEKRKTRSFFVFLTAVRSQKNKLTVYTRTQTVRI